MITYKGIEHERLGDAPFIGALIVASQCSAPCKNCFNLHLKDEDNHFSTEEKILEMVEQNPLNEGIILGGLEWTETPIDMLNLIRANEVRDNRLKIIVYTRLTESEFFLSFPSLLRVHDIWFKFGSYKEEESSEMYYQHGVKLASLNQRIVYRR